MNPFGFAYSSLEGVEAFAKPGAIIVTGRGNRYDPRFQEARKRGAKVYSYWNVANVPDNLSNPEDAAMYLVGGKPPPRWPYKTASGRDRSQWSGTYLLDLRPDSAWLKHIAAKSGEVIASGKFDGFFLDTLGARTWASLADWGNWTAEEQTAWATGSVNIAQVIAEQANRHNPEFELVHNNLWFLPATHPAAALAAAGEQHCNGICLENPTGSTPGEFHKAQAGRSFGRLPRRVLVIAKTDAGAIAWSKVPGVTHVCSVEQAKGETYARVTPPVVPYSGVAVPPPVDESAALRARVTELEEDKAMLTTKLADLARVNAGLKTALEEIHELSA